MWIFHAKKLTVSVVCKKTAHFIHKNSLFFNFFMYWIICMSSELLDSRQVFKCAKYRLQQNYARRNFHVEKISRGKNSGGETSIRLNFRAAKIQAAKFPVAKLPVVKLSEAKFPSVKLPVTLRMTCSNNSCTSKFKPRLINDLLFTQRSLWLKWDGDSFTHQTIRDYIFSICN